MATPTEQLWRSDLMYPDESYRIVGGLLEVFHTLGAGFVYRVYASACYYELVERGFEVKRIRQVQVTYKEVVLGEVTFGHILVDGRIMVFPVAINDLNEIRLDDLKLWMSWADVKLGILANFNAVQLELRYIRI